MSGPRTLWWGVGALAFTVAAGACADDDGADAPPRPTLPPIATTSTIAPSTTISLLNQARFITIEQGDILSDIAQEYQVSQDDLMAKNGITDPDAVYVGQVLELPEEAVIPGAPGPTSLAVTPTAP